MVIALETSVDLLARSEEKKERTGKDQGSAERVPVWRVHDFRGEDEMGPPLMSIYIKEIEGNHDDGAAQGEGGGGL